MMSVFPKFEVASVPPHQFDYDSLAIPDGLIFIAPVKGVARMTDKVREYARKSQTDQELSWPFIQKVGDVLRCTVEVETGDLVWYAWESIRTSSEFQVARLKNKMALENVKVPPDMLLNVTIQTEMGYSLVTEIQIHLRAIHKLKQEEHILYEIRRTNSPAEFYGFK